MILKKRNANPHFVNGGGSQRKSIEPDDHWAFLDEIEAPMWVDFTLEALSTDKDIEDDWFQTAHTFHECSSQHLLSLFFLSSEGKMKSPDLQHPSPKLPDSVSRSRGKHYKTGNGQGERHASRVEIKDGGLQKHRKSSTGKSSVGSSFNPGFNVECVNRSVTKEVLNSRKDTNTTQTNNNGNSLHVSKTAFSGRLRDRSSNLMTRWGGKATAASHMYSTAKILQSDAPRKPLQLHNVANPVKERVTTKSKMGSRKFNRVAGVGKENNAAGMAIMCRNQKVPTLVAGLDDGNGLTNLKGKTGGKSQGRNPANVVHTVHFR